MNGGSATSASALIADASWLAHRYDPGHDAVHFRLVTRERRASVPFLTDEHLGEVPPLVIRRAEAVAATQPSPIHFIFHSAYCCSTLLAAALDVPGVASSLSEPVILNDIVGWRRRGASDTAVRAVLDDAIALLSRPFEEGEAVVVKPSNAATCLIDGVLDQCPGARALLLYAPLRDYLLSIAKKGATGGRWVRTLLDGLINDGLVATDLLPKDGSALTDLQVAAVGWLAQQSHFAILLERHGPARVRALDSATLLSRPKGVLLSISDLFELPALNLVAAEVAASHVFRTHSKSGARFDGADRRAEQRDAETRHGREVDRAEDWARERTAKIRVALHLGHRLMN